MGANVIVAMATMFTVGYFCAGVRGYDQKAKLICGAPVPGVRFPPRHAPAPSLASVRTPRRA